jgi:hypothetical protein
MDLPGLPTLTKANGRKKEGMNEPRTAKNYNPKLSPQTPPKIKLLINKV